MRVNRAGTTLQIASDFGALPRCTIVEWQRREWGEERIQLGVLRAFTWDRLFLAHRA